MFTKRNGRPEFINEFNKQFHCGSKLLYLNKRSEEPLHEAVCPLQLTHKIVDIFHQVLLLWIFFNSIHFKCVKNLENMFISY